MDLTLLTRTTAAVAVAAGLLLSLGPPASARLIAGHGADARAVALPPPALLPTVQSTAAGDLLCEVVDGLPLCTHGDDAHLAGASTAKGEGDASTPSSASTRIGCYRSGPRVQAVYARPAGAPDRFAGSLPSFRGWAGAVEKTVDDSARKTKGARHVRFASIPSGSSCTLSVLRVTLPVEAFTSFAATVNALREVGFDRVDEKYLVWADARG